MGDVIPCPDCGQKNRVPDKYTGIAVCGFCKTQMFPTQIVVDKPKRRFRWTHRDWHFAIPVVLLSFPIHWALTRDWLDWVGEMSVYMTIITAIALSWIAIGFSLKVSWEEWWRARQERRLHPAPPDTIDSLAAWEAASEYARLAHEHARRRFAMRKETQ